MGWSVYRWIVVCGLVWSTADDARASSCFAGIDVLLPNGGEAPPNTRVWIGEGYSVGTLRILDADDNEVPHSLSTLTRIDAGDTVTVLTPEQPLAPGEYVVADMNGMVTSFTVAGELDTMPPESPGGIVGSEPSDGCTYVESGATERVGELILARVDGLGNVETSMPSGEVTDLNGNGRFTIGMCGCEYTWADAEPGARFEIEFAAFDLAGNFSGWSAPDEAAIAEDDGSEGCGCTTQREPAGGLIALLLAAAFARRRRNAACDTLTP